VAGAVSMCEDHWDRLKTKVDEAGLSHLIADDGAAAARRMKQQIETEQTTAANFDPLLHAYFGILSNAGQIVSEAGGSGSALYVMTDGDEDPIDDPIFRSKAGRKTWPRCCVCYLNLVHKVTCVDRRCKLDKEAGYDWMLDRATQDAVTKARELGLVEAPS
jgi:hypothetical protein